MRTKRNVNRIVNRPNFDEETQQLQQKERRPATVTTTPAVRCPCCGQLHHDINKLAHDLESNTRSCVRCHRVYNNEEEEAAEWKRGVI